MGKVCWRECRDASPGCCLDLSTLVMGRDRTGWTYFPWSKWGWQDTNQSIKIMRGRIKVDQIIFRTLGVSREHTIKVRVLMRIGGASYFTERGWYLEHGTRRVGGIRYNYYVEEEFWLTLKYAKHRGTVPVQANVISVDSQKKASMEVMGRTALFCAVRTHDFVVPNNLSTQYLLY